MLRRKLLVIAVSILLLLAALYVGVTVPVGNAAVSTDPHPDSPKYSIPGPHPVGMRNLTTNSEAPLDMTMWYPGLNDEDTEAKTRYAYEMKIGDPLGAVTVPVMAIGGTLDKDTPYMWGTHPTYEFVSSPAKVRVALVDAEHMIFTGPCEAVPVLLRFVSSEFCSDPGWDRNYAHNLINHFTTAFLLDTLKGDQSAHETLLPEQVQFDGIEYTTTLK